MHLQQQLRQVDAGQHRRRVLAQPGQAGGDLQGVEVFHRQPHAAVVAGNHPRACPVAGLHQPVVHLPPRGVEHGDQITKMGTYRCAQRKPVQDLRAHRVPRRAVEQLGSRVAPAL